MGFFSKLPKPAQFALDVGQVWYSVTGLGILWGTLTTGVSAVLLAVGGLKQRLPGLLGFLGPLTIRGPQPSAQGAAVVSTSPPTLSDGPLPPVAATEIADHKARLQAKKWYRDYAKKAYDAARKVLNTCPGKLGLERGAKQIVSDLLRLRVAYPFDGDDQWFEAALGKSSFRPGDILRWSENYRELLAWIGQFKIRGGDFDSTQWLEWRARHTALVEDTPGALKHDAFDSIQARLTENLDVTPGDPDLRP